MTQELEALDEVERFKALFRGSELAHGSYLQLTPDRKRVSTVPGPAPHEAWATHLGGIGAYLGQIPINRANMCSFGAIDVDDDSIDHAALARRVASARLPLVVCRSKSGGAHLYLFLSEPAEAGRVKDALGDLASMLGVSNPDGRSVELFPKQRRIEKGANGNWINLPYYGGDQTNRYAVDSSGAPQTLAQFLAHAEAIRTSGAELGVYLNPFRADGPPCLEKLHAVGLLEGSRNDGLFNVGLYFKTANPADWEDLLRAYNHERVSEPLEEAEISTLIGSLQRTDYSYRCTVPPIQQHCNRALCLKRKFGVSATQCGDREVSPNDFTDTRNAERFVSEYEAELRHCRELKSWFVFDGVRWSKDETGRVDRLALEHAKRVVSNLLSVVGNTGGTERRDAIAKLKSGVQLEQRPKQQHMVGLAATCPPVPIRAVELDCNPVLLNCLNGTLDLKTEVLRPHDRHDLITKLARVAYDPTAMCPRWDRFIDEITCGDKEYADFLQRAVGSCLTGEATDQKIFLCVGGGSNGKSVFLDVIRELLGDYATVSGFETFLQSQQSSGGSPRSDLVRLAGARFVVAVEAPEGKRFNEQVLKSLTGGDRVTARGLYTGEIEYTPQFKLWFATNHPPDVFGGDDGIWRRLLQLPFNYKVDESNRDPLLKDHLITELTGILAWAVRGFRMWRANDGVGSCACVAEATSLYKDDQDVLRDFLEERIEDAPGEHLKKLELERGYRQWALDQELTPIPQKALTRRLREKGWRDTKGRGRPWIGKRFRAKHRKQF